MKRRDFLKGSTALALLAASPSFAGLRLHGTSSPFISPVFNGGLSQGQGYGGGIGFTEWPFINYLKNQTSTGGAWQGTDTLNNGTDISPAWLATDGYPNQVGSGVYIGVSVPASSSFTDTMTLMWDVTGAGASDVATLAIGNFSTTPVSGSLSSTGNGTNFTYVFSLTGQANALTSFRLQINSLGGTAHVTNIRLYWTSHVSAANAGELLNPQYKTKLLAQKYGVYRFMDWWATNISNVTTWSTRRPIAAPTWFGSEYRASLYPGDIMTNSGNKYSLTFGSGAPTDKQTMHILLNANATLVQNAEAPRGTLTLTLPGGGSAVTFNWTGHPFSNGDLVSANTGNGAPGGSPIQNFWDGVNYYVVNKTANTFQVSLTSGGSPIGSTSTTTNNNMHVTQLQTLNLNSTGAVPFRDLGGQPFTDSSKIPYRTDGTVLRYGTVVYDAKLNSWLLVGAGVGGSFCSGILNPLPPEIAVQMCAELGMHPHFSIPYMALDTITDYVPSLASYVKNNRPSWMIPRFEPGNEVWNGNTPITQFARNKEFINWGEVFDQDDWYGMVLSLMGQAVASVYGIGNLGVTYEVMCGVATDGYGFEQFVNNSSPRLLATQFVASGPTPPAGYIQTAAKTYTSAMLCATYVNPGMEGQNASVVNAFQYYITNAGNSTAQMANLNAYANSFNRTTNGTGIFTVASPGVINWPSHVLSVGDPVTTGSTGTIPGGILGDMWVSNVIDADHFNVANSPGGSSLNFTGSQTGTQFVSYGSHFTNGYVQARYTNIKNFGSVNGVNKMFAYEGGYSPSQVNGGNAVVGLSSPWFSPITGATNASSCVLTLATTTPASTQSPTNFNSGNPAVAGMVLCLQSVGGMTQLNCASGVSVTLTSGNASIPYAGNTLVANQGIVFQPNDFATFPANISPDTPYYVSATGLSGSAFQISATQGGAVIAPSGSGTFNIDTGWIVTAVGVGGANNVTILCNSTGFGTYTAATGTASYLSATNFVNKFMIAVLQSATALPANLLANYNNFTGAGGLFPSQYGMSAGFPPTVAFNVWSTICGDMYQPLNQQGQMIAAYN